jgi:hypothetical protein
MNAASTLSHWESVRHDSQPGRLDRLALTVGTALVSWGERRQRRTPVSHETQQLRMQAQREVEQISARRDLGASQLLR